MSSSKWPSPAWPHHSLHPTPLHCSSLHLFLPDILYTIFCWLQDAYLFSDLNTTEIGMSYNTRCLKTAAGLDWHWVLPQEISLAPASTVEYYQLRRLEIKFYVRVLFRPQWQSEFRQKTDDYRCTVHILRGVFFSSVIQFQGWDIQVSLQSSSVWRDLFSLFVFLLKVQAFGVPAPCGGLLLDSILGIFSFLGDT